MSYIKPVPDIQGWMTDIELQTLYQWALGMNSIVEVGSWMGKSTHALCSGCSGQVIAVDHFKGSESQRNNVHSIANHINIFNIFMQNLSNFNNLSVMRMGSIDAAKLYSDKSVDMVFIDGDHDYDKVKADIEVWLPKCKRILCGHDYGEGGVAQFLNDSGLPYKQAAGTLWFVEVG